MSSEAALLEEISRLSGAISKRKEPPVPRPPPYHRTTSGYKPPYRPRNNFTDYTPIARPGAAAPATKEVVIDGVTFESNGKTLVRKTASTSSTPPALSPLLGVAGPSTVQQAPPQPATSPVVSSATVAPPAVPLVRTRNGLIAADRLKKPVAKTLPRLQNKGRYPPAVTGYRTRAPPGRNLTLNKKTTVAKPKKFDKQCKHFARTGMCGRGMTCRYQHDPQKIALCPLFLAEKCPHKANPAECDLSHDATPERTPICTRFNSTGECYKGQDCLYPHIRVGPKSGVCRDFAVLGYCEKGAMCEASHLKECPDFAETGVCKKMGLKGVNGCKLPHVIRANQRRIGIAKAPTVAPQAPVTVASGKRKAEDDMDTATSLDDGTSKKVKLSPLIETGKLPVGSSVTAEDANEFISLTIVESDDEEGDDDDDEEDEEEESLEEQDQDDEDDPMPTVTADDDSGDESDVNAFL